MPHRRTSHRRTSHRSPAFFAILVLVVAVFHRLEAQSVILKDAFPTMTFSAPVDVQHAGDGTDRLFIVRQAGYIVVVPNSVASTTSKTFLDIDAKVVSGGELGLLGLAFHPSYESNGYFYVNYTANSPLRTVISRFSVSAANPDSADPASETILLEIEQPYSNHNGGQLAFGPDGYLYIGMGDGGSGGDPENRAQDLTTLLGKMLRIDVDTAADPLGYAIPPTNPWAGNSDGYREEIFAYGLRNPWRFSFDPANGRGWIGDVGQGEWEEVDTLAIGANYGWRLKEGDHCFDPAEGCDTIPGLTDPVWEYAHSGTGGCSITGGYVYRGVNVPSLIGKYVFGDYCSGRIWTIDTEAPGGWTTTLLLDSNRSITSFGVDRRGEIYVCSAGDGRIFRLTAVYPPTPAPRSPGDGASGIPADTTLIWSSSPGTVRYHLQLAADAGFTILLVDDTTLTDTSRPVGGLPPGQTLRWKVRARNEVGWSPFSAAWVFTTAPESGVAVDLAEGWNIVSLPAEVTESALDSLYDGVVSGAFRYDPDSGYVTEDTLATGAGYWVKFSAAQVTLFDGDARTNDTLVLAAGWNLVGGLGVPVEVDSIETSPAGIVASSFFGYDGSYLTAAVIEPGRGYWVKLSAPGEMVLRGAAAFSARAASSSYR